MHNLGILLSGRGSNFVAIADSIDGGRIRNARIAVVISNKADVPGITSAQRRGFDSLVIPSKGKPREEHDREIVAYCRGPYCVFADEAVALLQAHGYTARRLEEGVPDWRQLGLPVAI